MLALCQEFLYEFYVIETYLTFGGKKTYEEAITVFPNLQMRKWASERLSKLPKVTAGRWQGWDMNLASLAQWSLLLTTILTDFLECTHKSVFGSLQ